MSGQIDSAPSVTHVAPNDKGTRATLKEIASAAFPTPQNKFVTLSDHVLAAQVQGDIAGGVVLNLVDGTDGPVGIISWLFTKPDAQGAGVGSRLLESAIEYLRDRNCQAAVAVVHWTNTPSSKLFARRGFERTSSFALARRFGLKQAGLVYARSQHFMNFSCDLWSRKFSSQAHSTESHTLRASERTQQTNNESTRSQWRSVGRFGETLLVHAILLMIVVGGITLGSWDQTVLVAGVVGGLLIAVRLLLYFGATIRDETQWMFWSWGNVYPFAGGIALFGGFVPVPGHVAPKQRDWSYETVPPVLGPVAALWGALLLAGLIALVGVGDRLDDAVQQLLQITLTVFVVMDIWLVIWPFNGYNGRLVYDWNRIVWGILAVGAAVTVGLVYVV